VPYLSTRELVLGERDANNRTALDKLRLAADLNPFSIEPLIVSSTIWVEAGNPNKAVAVAREAVARNPQAWTAWQNLSDAAHVSGEQALERDAHRRAVELNPYLATRPNG
jgi:tetratricopeptide (TPR) repeat protein